jgi:protocatechuate 3,4-dioxygenase beta subunit
LRRTAQRPSGATRIDGKEFTMRNDTAGVHPSRREAIRALTASAAAVLATPLESVGAAPQLAALSVPACVVVPSQTEGPYFIDKRLQRSDIRVDPSSGLVKAGVPVTLAINLSRLDNGGCAPLGDAVIDIWQCDAEGRYSDVIEESRRFDTRGQQFLRGYQLTDRDGRAEFTTIFPGWYPGRTVHIHFKVRTNASAGRAGEFTSQWYFDDAVSDEVLAAGPYAANGARQVRNDRDRIFRRGGRELMLSVSRTASGYAATFDLAVRM